jgi:dihydrofolate synthase/folylpolyglutamate synthase
VPVVAGEMPPEALEVIQAKAVQSNAQLIRIGADVTYQTHSISLRGGQFSYKGIRHSFSNLELGLLGRHQIANAAVALATLELYEAQRGSALDEKAVREGLRRVRFAGRIEIVQQTPMVVLDGAHNEEKIEALVEAIKDIFSYNRLFVVLGMLETKDAESIVQQIASLADVLLATAPQVKGKPAIPPAELVRLASKVGGRLSLNFESPEQALERALGLAGPDDLVLVTGSLYLVGELRAHWHNTSEIIALRKMFIS